MVLSSEWRSKTMSKKKKEFLKKEGILNPNPERVLCSKFKSLDFCDPLDLPQVRYEMIRSARVGDSSVSEACRLFGFSREYFYRLERNFMERGYVSLLGSRKGRRPLIALNREIVNYVAHRKMEEPNLSGEKLRSEILRVYKVQCSRRTVERIVERLGFGKKGGRGHSP
jgi:transposase